MEEETLYNILTGQYGEILETHAMWQCIASLGIKPFKDRNQWCYLYGDNIQEGICGFGETIYKAAWDFYTNIKTEEARQEQPDKYETALEKAREWMPNVNQGGHAILISIFPELGEGLDPRYGGRKQDQPEVDLEKEIEKEWEKLEKDYSPSALDKSVVIVSGLVGQKQFSQIAKHFYELGKVLNARKEE